MTRYRSFRELRAIFRGAKKVRFNPEFNYFAHGSYGMMTSPSSNRSTYSIRGFFRDDKQKQNTKHLKELLARVYLHARKHKEINAASANPHVIKTVRRMGGTATEVRKAPDIYALRLEPRKAIKRFLHINPAERRRPKR